jgi:hypothetical protein
MVLEETNKGVGKGNQDKGGREGAQDKLGS